MYQWMKQQLEAEFEVLRCLKEGQRSKIYLICHKKTKKCFVLRWFKGNGEVYRSLLSCRCAYLPEILEAASCGEQNLILEEYIQGDPLSDLLAGCLFTQKETSSIVRDVCRGLWVLHSLGAVHRDVKPENIVLRGDHAVLIDFDAARLVRPEQSTDTHILGTTGFAAPEQYGFSQSDLRADVYAVGVLINVMLTGLHPSCQLAEGRLGRVVSECTKINPDERYQDMRRLMEVL